MEGFLVRDGKGIDGGIRIFGGDGIEDEQLGGIMVVGPLVWLGVGIGDSIGIQSSSNFHLEAVVPSFHGCHPSGISDMI